MFEGLSEKLQSVFRKLMGRGKLSEKEVREGLREVKLALLEADVHFAVVKSFIQDVTQRAVGSEVLESLTPGQQVIKIVNEELTKLMGSSHSKITFSSKPVTVLMLVGLQGSGKTTMAGKLAAYLRKQYGKKPLLAACDIYRPAAIEQLKVVGEKAGVPVFEMGQAKPEKIVAGALKQAEKYDHDVVLVDTAGRLHIDEQLMDELVHLKKLAQPQEILLVVDAMTGQDAVNVAETFHQKLGIDGVLLTKLDGDTRGGAALSVRAVTQKPIKFVGVGEKIGDIEAFHPDRMASRILGMGDILTLIEQAQASFDEKKAQMMAEKLKKQQFDLEDFLQQFQQVKKMGGIGSIISKLPGLGMKGMDLSKAQVDERQLSRQEAIIRSMTPQERQNPDVINASRRRRIALGSGTTVQEVNRLLNQFNQTKTMIKQMTGGKGLGRFKLPF